MVLLTLLCWTQNIDYGSSFLRQREAVELELEVVLEEAAATVNILRPIKEGETDHGGSINVGLTLTTEALVEGQPGTSLLDTRSPVTILSL